MSISVVRHRSVAFQSFETCLLLVSISLLFVFSQHAQASYLLLTGLRIVGQIRFLARTLLCVKKRLSLPHRMLFRATQVRRPPISGLCSITVRRPTAVTSRGASSRVVSKHSAASVAVISLIIRARVARLLLICHMIVLVVYDSHVLQISNKI
jgi:hypothetical protein